MKRLVSLAVAVLALLVAGQISARANTIFSNFGSGESFNSDSGYSVGSGLVIASAFTPTSNITLSRIDIALSYCNAASYCSGTNNGATVLLEKTGAGGLPGGSVSALESWTLGPLPTYGSPFVPEALFSSGGMTLMSGTQYWLIADPAGYNTTDVWNSNTSVGPGGLTEFAVGISPTSQWFLNNTDRANTGLGTPAFDVLGTPITATPERGSTVLFLGLDLLILAGLAVPLRRRLVSLA